MMRWGVLLTAATLLLSSCGGTKPIQPEIPAALGAASGVGPTASAQPPGDAFALTDTVLSLAIWRDSDDGGSLHQVDAWTGADLPDRDPIFLGPNYWHALSPDGRTLAVVSLPQGNTPSGGVLRLIDLEKWSDRETEVRVDLWPTKIAYGPDGSRLAVGASSWNDHVLVIFDTAAGTILAEGPLGFNPLDIVFTPDGKSLMLYGARYPGTPGLNPLPMAALLDSTDMRMEWQLNLDDIQHGVYAAEGLSSQQTHDTSVSWHPAVVFAPESRKMFLVHADADNLTTVDFAGRSRQTVAIHRAKTWLERLMAFGTFPASAKELNGTTKAAVLSADGERLYIVGRKLQSSQDANGYVSVDETSLGLTVVEVRTGETQASIETPATVIGWATDGRHLFLGGWSSPGWTDVISTENLEVRALLPQVDLHSAAPVDGAPLLAAASAGSGARSRVQLVETASWEVIHEWTTPGYAEVWRASRRSAP